ncbi:MAG: hypothetical protein ABIS47_09920 [Acidimicrobiales bacterium]
MGRERRTGPINDAGWIVVGLVAVLGLVGSGAEAGVAIFGGDLWLGVRAAAGVLGGWWFVVGAWRRTSWGRPATASRPEAPVLSARAAGRLIALAALCLASVGVALFLQLVTAG